MSTRSDPTWMRLSSVAPCQTSANERGAGRQQYEVPNQTNATIAQRNEVPNIKPCSSIIYVIQEWLIHVERELLEHIQVKGVGHPQNEGKGE